MLFTANSHNLHVSADTITVKNVGFLSSVRWTLDRCVGRVLTPVLVHHILLQALARRTMTAYLN